jgi:pimeloyl-[acyl-carrier protein] synthase
VSMDPPEHTRLRSLVRQAFTPAAITARRGTVEQAARSLINDLQTKGSFDLVAEFARPFPVSVITDMLGIPVHDVAEFAEWSYALSATIEDSGPETIMKAVAASDKLSTHVLQTVQERRVAPKDDLLTALIRAQEEDGAALSEDELVATCMLLLVAGHETTANLIGNGMWLLLSHPEQRQLLIDRPELLRKAIDEILRFEPPGKIAFRWASEDFSIGTNSVQRGERVALDVGAANRDPEVFADPEVFDITRDASQHLTFGAGIHYCLGAPLALLEAEVAFAELFRALPSIALSDPERAEWQDRISLHGLQSLWCTT